MFRAEFFIHRIASQNVDRGNFLDIASPVVPGLSNETRFFRPIFSDRFFEVTITSQFKVISSQFDGKCNIYVSWEIQGLFKTWPNISSIAGHSRIMKIFGLFGFAAAEEIVRYDGDKVYGFENLTNGVIQHIKVY